MNAQTWWSLEIRRVHKAAMALIRPHTLVAKGLGTSMLATVTTLAAPSRIRCVCLITG